MHRPLKCLVGLAICTVLTGGACTDIDTERVTTRPPPSTTTTTSPTHDEGPQMIATLQAAQHQRDVLEELAAFGRWTDAVVAVDRRRSAPGTAGMFTATTPGIGFGPAMPAELLPFFTCVAEHESGGNYAAVNPSGKYRGRYQMDASFWRSHAPAEWKHLADTRNWETAPADVQDATAVAGYYNQGPGAWSGPGGAICREHIR